MKKLFSSFFGNNGKTNVKERIAKALNGQSID